MNAQTPYIRWLEEINMDNLQEVGGKNASLGALVQNLKSEGIRVPDGSASTAQAYWDILENNDLQDSFRQTFDDLRQRKIMLQQVGQKVRNQLQQAKWPEKLIAEIKEAYADQCGAHDSLLPYPERSRPGAKSPG